MVTEDFMRLSQNFFLFKRRKYHTHNTKDTGKNFLENKGNFDNKKLRKIIYLQSKCCNCAWQNSNVTQCWILPPVRNQICQCQHSKYWQWHRPVQGRSHSSTNNALHHTILVAPAHFMNWFWQQQQGGGGGGGGGECHTTEWQAAALSVSIFGWLTGEPGWWHTEGIDHPLIAAC